MKNTALFDVARKLLHNRSSKMEQREKVLSDTHAQLHALLLRTYLQSKDRHAIDEMMFLFFGVQFNEFYDTVRMEDYTQRMAAELEEFNKDQQMTVEEYYYTHFKPATPDVIKDRMLRFPIHPEESWPAEYYDRYPMGKSFSFSKDPDFMNKNVSQTNLKSSKEIFYKLAEDFSNSKTSEDQYGLSVTIKQPHYSEEELARGDEFEREMELRTIRPSWFDEQMKEATAKFFGQDIADLLSKKAPAPLDFKQGFEGNLNTNEDQVVFTFNLPKVLKVNGDNELILERIVQLKAKRQYLLSLPKEKRGELQETIKMINRLKTWMN